MENYKCIYCGSENISKWGSRILLGGKKIQRYKCKNCQKYFTENNNSMKQQYGAPSIIKEIDNLTPEQFFTGLVNKLKDNQLIKNIQYKTPFSGKQIESAVLLLSDIHIGKTNIFMNPETGALESTYNSAIFQKQAQNLFISIRRIIDLLSTSYKIEKLYIFSLGDIVDNDLIYRGQKFFVDMNSGEQLWTGTAVIAEMFRELLGVFKEVEVFSVPGNHGRMTPQREASFATRNFDYHFMRILEIIFANEPRIKFNIPQSYFAYPRIYNHRYFIHHGDDTYSWQSMPYYGIVRKSSKRRTEYNFDLEAIGHFHSAMEIPTSSHCITIVNGGWISKDNYTWEKYGIYSKAEQIFFGVSPKYFRTWSFNLNIDDL